MCLRGGNRGIVPLSFLQMTLFLSVTLRSSAHTRVVSSQISCCWDENQIRWYDCTGWVAPSQGVYVTQVLVHEAQCHNSFITCNAVEQQHPLWLQTRRARRENCWFRGPALTMSFGWHLEEADFLGFFLIPLDHRGTSTCKAQGVTSWTTYPIRPHPRGAEGIGCIEEPTSSQYTDIVTLLWETFTEILLYMYKL